MAQYKVKIGSRARDHLLKHTAFISKVSPNAAKQFRDDFSDIVKRLKDNPFQFPMHQKLNALNLHLREAFFNGRYKALFTVEESEVFIDAIADCRQKPEP